MNPDDLELVSTQALIAELLRRTTFQGVIVHADEARQPHWTGERLFHVRYNRNLDRVEVARLLGVVGEHIALRGE